MGKSGILNVLGVFLLTVSLATVVSASRAISQDNVLVKYQGRLTNQAGEPLNGTFELTFAIYDAAEGGSSLWSEAHFDVEVSQGLFTVMLGSHSPLPESTFDGTDRYLGITVDSDPEMSPRSLLTSVPSAAYAQKMAGDISTSEGMMVIKDRSGDSAMTLYSGVASNIAGIEFNDPADGGQLLTLMANRSANEAALNFMDPTDGRTLFSLSSSALNGISALMFNPQPEPPAMLFELTGNSADGPSMSFHNGGTPVMTAESNPLGGFSIQMEDPDGEEPLQIHLELGSAMGFMREGDQATDGGFLSLFSPTDLTETHMMPGALTMQFNAAGAVGPPLYLGANQSAAEVAIGTSDPMEALTVMGNGWFSGEVFTLTATKTKDNVAPIDGALEKVSRMNGYYYNFKADPEYSSLRLPSTRQIGFLAEEVAQVVPEVVKENDQGLTGVNYSRITALLVEAIKELREENEELRSRVEQLESR